MQAGGCLTSSISLSRRMLLGVLSTSLQGSSSAAAGAPSQPRCPSPAGSSHPTGRSSSWSGCGQRQVSIPAGQREQQLPNPSVGRFPSSVWGLREGPEVRGNGHEAEPTAQLPATAQVPCRAVPWHPARPCHRCTRNSKGVWPPEGEEGVEEEEEEKAGTASTTAAPEEGVKPCVFPLCPRPG